MKRLLGQTTWLIILIFVCVCPLYADAEATSYIKALFASHYKSAIGVNITAIKGIATANQDVLSGSDDTFSSATRTQDLQNAMAADSANNQLANDVFESKTYSSDVVVLFDGDTISWLHIPSTVSKGAVVKVIALCPNTYSCTLTNVSKVYGPTQIPSAPTVGAGGSAFVAMQIADSGLTFTADGDDEIINVAFSKLIGTGANAKPESFPSASDYKTVHVNYSVPEFAVTYSLGLLDSTLHDDSITLVPNGTGTSSVQGGEKSESTVKGIAFTHLILLKSGNVLLGPSIGAVSSGGYFLGGSILVGAQSRLCITLGSEWSKVTRLNTVSYHLGETVPNGTAVTQSVYRQSPLEIALTYSLTPPASSNTSQKQ